jgi:TorA maturation chaperone TorD
MIETPLERAVAIAGGQSALARKLGVKQANVWHWLNRAEHVPAEQAIAIEHATGGQVVRGELRPDLFASATAPTAAVIADEDAARAMCWGLLSALLARAPDGDLLAKLARLGGDQTPIGQALGAVAEAAKRAEPAVITREFHDLFVGLVRGELVPFASYYRTGFLNEKPLAAVRGDFQAIGAARADGVFEPEDGAASLAEAMAGLIDGRFGAPADPSVQRRFFERHLAPWIGRFFADLEAAGTAVFYRAVGRFGRTLVEVERDAFALIEIDAVA